MVLIVSHGNSLRALCKHLDDISDEDIKNLYIPHGSQTFKQIDSMMMIAMQNYAVVFFIFLQIVRSLNKT